MKKPLIYFILACFLIQNSSAAWNIKMDLLPEKVSENSTSIIIAEIRDSNNRIINPENCEQYSISYTHLSSDVLNFRDNSTYWFAELNTGPSIPTPVRLDANGKCYGVFDGNSTVKNLTYGKIDLFLSPIQNIVAGQNFALSVKATKNNSVLSTANLTAFLFNPEDKQTKSYQMTYDVNNTLFTTVVKAPDLAGKYFLYITAINGSDNSTDFGGIGKVVVVNPGLKGNLILKTASGKENFCSQDLSSCETGAEIEVLFQEIEDGANSAILEVNGLRNLVNINMSRLNSTHWKANFSIPVNFNFSLFGNSLEVKVNASSNTSAISIYKNVSVLALDANLFISKLRVLPEEEITIQVQPFRPFSKKNVLKEEVSSIQLFVFSPSNISVLNRSTQDFEFSSGIFSTKFTFPRDSESGKNKIRVVVEDNSSGFKLEKTLEIILERSASGPILLNTTRISENFTKAGIYKIHILLNNTINKTILVDHLTEYQEGNWTNIASISTGNNSEGKIIYPYQTEITTLLFDIKEIDNNKGFSGNFVYRVFQQKEDKTGFDLIGYIKLPIIIEVNFTQKIEVEPKSIDVEAQESGSFSITIKNSGPTINLSLSLDGNISEVLRFLEPYVVVPQDSEESVNFFYEASRDLNGKYNGAIILSTEDGNAKISVPVVLLINVTIKTKDFSFEILNKNIEVIKGQNAEFEYTLENKGEVELKEITIRVATVCSVSGVSGRTSIQSLGVGQQEKGKIVLGTANLNEGRINCVITALTADGISKESVLQLLVQKDYSKEISFWRSKVEEYKIKASQFNKEKVKTLNEILGKMETSLSQLEEKVNLKDYSSADSLLTILADFDKNANNEISKLETPPEPPKRGFPILLIIIVVVIVLIIGVIVYLSIVPD